MAHDDTKVLKKVKLIDARGRGLTPPEIDFIADLIDRDVKTFTAAQSRIVDRIYTNRVPGKAKR